MAVHSVGEVSISQVLESRGPSFAPEVLFPNWDPVVLREHRELMVPDCFDDREKRLVSSIHSWVLRTRHHTILIDSCAGKSQEPGGSSSLSPNSTCRSWKDWARPGFPQKPST